MVLLHLNGLLVYKTSPPLLSYEGYKYYHLAPG